MLDREILVIRGEVHGAARTLDREDHPAPRDGVFPQLRHSGPPVRRARIPRRAVSAVATKLPNFLEAKLFDPVADLVAVHSQQSGGARAVAARALERPADELALELVETHTLGRRR